jgi:purine-binding chemotaxis protein CheW
MADSGVVRLVLFRLGPVLWAAPASAVQQVVAAGRTTRIPGTDRAVAGLVNVRGTLLTVVDGRRAVGLADSTERPESILVLVSGGRECGLAVDEVVDLIEATPEELGTGDVPPDVDPRLVRGTGKRGGQQFLILDPEALLLPVFG